MSEGTVAATFVIVFRETLEAGLIVGIILTVLARLHGMRYARYVWLSVGAVIGASIVVGLVLGAVTQGVQGQWEKVIEGVISLVACGVLTYMVFWMDRQAKLIRPQIETRLETAVTSRELTAIVALPFLAVFREGAETVLYLKAVAIQSSGAISWAGGLLGGALALVATLAIFLGGRRVPLKALFRCTSVLLLLIGAGLLAYGIHELQELGWIPIVVYPVWDINFLLNEKEGIGCFLKALFGYNGNPSLIEVVAYAAYLAGVVMVLRLVSRNLKPNGAPVRRPPKPAVMSQEVSLP